MPIILGKQWGGWTVVEEAAHPYLENCYILECNEECGNVKTVKDVVIMNQLPFKCTTCLEEARYERLERQHFIDTRPNIKVWSEV